NGIPGFGNTTDLSQQLASLYGGNFSNGLLSAAYGFPSIFSRFYPPFMSNASGNSAPAAGNNPNDDPLARMANFGGANPMAAWPTPSILPPPPPPHQGLSPG